MSHSEYTENYKLARFIDTDQPTFLGDWNETMDDIDGAIKGVADKETTLGNTVSALILRVDDHDERIGTLEDATEELESKTEDLQTKYDSIKTATATTAGLVKLSDSTTGTATDTALSQKGANDLEKRIAAMEKDHIRIDISSGSANFKTYLYYDYVGHIAQIDVECQTTHNLNGEETVGTIPAGYRPIVNMHQICDAGTWGSLYLVITTGGAVSVKSTAEVGLDSTSVYNTLFFYE